MIVPAKDASDYVADALTSLGRQVDEPRELQVVVVDDGSTDGTGDIVDSFRDRLADLVVLRNDRPHGLAAARNQGADAAAGRWLTFLDADDWMAPRRLPALVAACRRLGCAWVRTDHTTVNGRHRVRRQAPEGLRGVALDPRDSIVPAAEITMVDYPYAWAGIFDRALKTDGLLDFVDGLHTAEDRPWIWNLHLNGPRYAVVDAPSICYRRGVSTSLTQVYDSRQLDFARAFGVARDVLMDDAESARFLPKLVRTIVAVTMHHYRNSSRMAPGVYADFLAVSSALLKSLPVDLVVRQAASGPPERTALVDGLLGPDWAALPVPTLDDLEATGSAA
ncbi:glycosyltransferase family 2 protein [Isoptericola jiangsuensis]|uniref:glycosyltransferase family 2 protein n=1 Tax=Isoptericola jiangsuensis TaxID=548579 RepID=UPI001473C5A6|nr:glycosyltransferase family 2 protein [Isoptericola jiangsuensis]